MALVISPCLVVHVKKKKKMSVWVLQRMRWLGGQQPSQKWMSVLCASYFGAGGDGAPPWQGLEGGGDLRRGWWPMPGSLAPAAPIADCAFRLLCSGLCSVVCVGHQVCAFRRLFTLGITQLEQF